ncbi:glycosyltransferase [Novosphingobium sp. TH158]|uniref:glycosyltransferase n=1 Tax=Novosphingobium sp. TH158 TaxID=2067455 RepID=UPI000C7D5D6A|nr:glycosyltransferase [Novosphingobium sp. TH158]PLK27031.1 hypothetical protein C0V78_09155 [Novosphingobium sp. TH158]
MKGPLHGRTIGLLTASASRQGGGVFEAVVAQARLIESLGGRPRVFALEDGDTERDRDRFGAVQVEALPVWGPRQIGFAPGLVERLIAADLDLLHLHGIWMYPSRAGSVWAIASGKPYIVSPHGMLDPWITARGRWKKALARAGYERNSWSRAWALHGLTEAEAGDIAREAGRQDVLIIPNAGPPAGDHPGELPPPVVAYLGRIHAKKNLVALVEGWSRASKPAGARLRIGGWGDDADVAALQSAIAASDGSIEFLGALFGDDKRALIEGARFMVLPSHSEGLPMAMLEAWAAGRPTIMTTQCNLPEGFAAGAALDSGFDPAAIARAVETALALDAAQWRNMAEAALRLAAGPFSEQAVAARWGAAYAGALAGGTPR